MYYVLLVAKCFYLIDFPNWMKNIWINSSKGCHISKGMLEGVATTNLLSSSNVWRFFFPFFRKNDKISFVVLKQKVKLQFTLQRTVMKIKSETARILYFQSRNCWNCKSLLSKNWKSNLNKLQLILQSLNLTGWVKQLYILRSTIFKRKTQKGFIKFLKSFY
jgi:hypothetical protein